MEAHRALGELVPIPPPPPPIEERFLCEVVEQRGIFRTVYTYAATEAEIRELGYTPDDFPHTVLSMATPDKQSDFRAFNETKEEK